MFLVLKRGEIFALLLQICKFSISLPFLFMVTIISSTLTDNRLILCIPTDAPPHYPLLKLPPESLPSLGALPFLDPDVPLGGAVGHDSNGDDT